MKHEVTLKPFQTPNFAICLGDVGGRGHEWSVPIHTLSDEELEGMCKQFRDDMFAKKARRVAGEPETKNAP